MMSAQIPYTQNWRMLLFCLQNALWVLSSEYGKYILTLLNIKLNAREQTYLKTFRKFQACEILVTYIVDNTLCYPLKWCSLTHIYKEIHGSKFTVSCPSYITFFLSVHGSAAKRKLHKHSQTAIQCLAKFLVQVGKLSLVLMIFC